jgi:hypothetical protein
MATSNRFSATDLATLSGMVRASEKQRVRTSR